MKKAVKATPNQLLSQTRQRHGWSQQQVAEQVGTDAFTVCRWERGFTLPSPFYRKRLCALFGLEAGELGLVPPTREYQPARLASSARLPEDRTDAVESLPSAGMHAEFSWSPLMAAGSTRLIGREDDVSAICQRLLCPEVRLLTLCGPGGVGKTRLAVQIAAELIEKGVEDIRGISLATLHDPQLLAATLAHALGIPITTAEPLEQMLCRHLCEQHLLLVLDNFEQLTAAAALLATLLAACPHLKLLVTSRTPLHIQGEYRYPVYPLPLPVVTSPLPSIETLLTVPSVALFVHRVQEVVPDFTLNRENGRVVAEICTRLDGLPLAIELAAPWVRLFTPAALLARLEHPLSLLTHGSRDLPMRQQTLRNTLAWSHALLTPQEQALFRVLSVCIGGCTLEVAATLHTSMGGSAGSMLDEIAALFDQHLLVSTSETTGEPRIGMMEIIREYGLEMLEAAGEADEVAQAHARAYLAMAETAEPYLKGADQAIWLERLEREHANLRAALHCAWEHSMLEVGLRLTGSLTGFWKILGHVAEGREWLQRMLAMAEHAGCTHRALDHPLAAARAKALHGAGTLAYCQGECAYAQAYFHDSLAAYRQMGDALGVAHASNNLGIVLTQLGDLTGATACYEESLSHKRRLGDAHGIATTLNNLGDVAACQGDWGAADKWYRESLAGWHALGDTQNTARTLANLGEVAQHQGNAQDAIRLLEESVTLSHRVNAPRTLAHALHALGSVACEQGDLCRALQRYREACELEQQAGDRASVAYSLQALAALRSKQGRYQDAVRLCGAAAAQRDALGLPLNPADRTQVEQLIAHLHMTMAEETFTVAWSAGRTLSLEEAIAEGTSDFASPDYAAVAQDPLTSARSTPLYN